MTGYRRGSVVLFILHLSVHSWPESQAVYWAWETSSVLLLNSCDFLLFSPSSLFPASRRNKTGYNNLTLLVNWGKSLSIQRHFNSGYFWKCHHVLCIMLLPCATNRSYSVLFFILMATLFMQGDKNMSGQQNCPSNYSHMSFTKILRNVVFSFWGIYQRNANFLSLFPSICQEAACQINNLDWLRHHKKTKPSVISAALLITNNKILAKTNGSVIILVNFSLPWLNKSYWTICCFKMSKCICNIF